MTEVGIPDGAFALGTFAVGDEIASPGLVHADGRVVDISQSWTTLHDVFDDWGSAWPALEAIARSAPGAAEHRYATLRPLVPLAHPDILQAGANFRRHVIDMVVGEQYEREPGQSLEDLRTKATEMMDRRAADGEPYIFSGLASALCGATDDVELPPYGDKPDWELELAVVFGATARNVSPDEAMEYVAGYTIANDLSLRDRLFRTDVGAMNVDFVSSKQAPTFLPVGPVILPAAFMGPLDDVRITLRVNGEVRQDETLADMIFSIPKLIAYTSSRALLRPGDLLLTGSPAGNGAHWRQFLTDGDVMDGTITGLGAQRNRCVGPR
jgi:2-keto-4-pentenoate hydratase/2-oxohepta-3-ene-1,7-dioic acid hydratase in catechol pathway